VGCHAEDVNDTLGQFNDEQHVMRDQALDRPHLSCKEMLWLAVAVCIRIHIFWENACGKENPWLAGDRWCTCAWMQCGFHRAGRVLRLQGPRRGFDSRRAELASKYGATCKARNGGGTLCEARPRLNTQLRSPSLRTQVFAENRRVRQAKLHAESLTRIAVIRTLRRQLGLKLPTVLRRYSPDPRAVCECE
jgi:hypothetical protein